MFGEPPSLFTLRAAAWGYIGNMSSDRGGSDNAARIEDYRARVCGRLQMVRKISSDDAEDAARRRRHAAATARWRSRQRRCVELFQIEAGSYEYELAIRYGGLRQGSEDKIAIAAALGRLLRRALVALLRENTRGC